MVDRVMKTKECISLSLNAPDDPPGRGGVDARLAAIADSRYYIRRAFRIIDDEARKAGLDPLECQALVQLVGAPDATQSVTDLALRLDVPRGLVSRIAKALDERGLVVRAPSLEDRRVTLVTTTEAGHEMVRRVDAAVQPRFEVLQQDMSLHRRSEALRIWAGNFGFR